jgi:hypothetical protein
MIWWTAVDDDAGEEISSASCRARYGEIGEDALIVVILVALVTSDEAWLTGVVVGRLGSEEAGVDPETP